MVRTGLVLGEAGATFPREPGVIVALESYKIAVAIVRYICHPNSGRTSCSNSKRQLLGVEPAKLLLAGEPLNTPSVVKNPPSKEIVLWPRLVLSQQQK